MMKLTPSSRFLAPAISFALAAALATTVSATPDAPTLKVRIEATDSARKLLLDRLNANGPKVDRKHPLQFESADSGYDYRIVFTLEQRPYESGYGTKIGSAASVDVFDVAGAELFKFTREGQASDKDAANAAATEIIKRVIKLREAKNSVM